MKAERVLDKMTIKQDKPQNWGQQKIKIPIDIQIYFYFFKKKLIASHVTTWKNPRHIIEFVNV